LSTTSCAVLGLLLGQSRSGYEVAGIVAKSVARFWPIEKSQVYTELARLEELGYVHARDVAQQRRPDKRVFELTESGRTQFERWLTTPGHLRERRRNPFLVKLFFGAHLSPDQLTALIAAQRADAEADRTSYRAIVDHLADRPEARFGRATAVYGLRRAEATIAWCDQMGPELINLAPEAGNHLRGGLAGG
jgi:DNA-binding PadR family transcriptional regulator